jgi:uncharacterized membrane protein YdjX (TVP38/TMEM64 family)
MFQPPARVGRSPGRTALTEGTALPGQRSWLRLLLLPTLIALGIAAIAVFHLDRYLSSHVLAANRAWLLREVAHNLIVAVLSFACLYVAATALSLPGASFLTIAAGFLFGSIFGTAIAVVSATLGATLLFAIARTSFGEIFRGRSEGALGKLKQGFGRNAFNYLLFLRLVPLFPFWLINLVAAFLGVPLRTFVIGTAFGIVPGAAVYATLGSGLGGVLDRGQTPNFKIIFSLPILVPILALAALSLAPIVYRRIRGGDG